MPNKTSRPLDLDDEALDHVQGGGYGSLTLKRGLTGGDSQMTEADLDNGRLIADVGVAPTKPAEFVIFRIGQKTADAGR